MPEKQSLIELLPKIVREGKEEAEKILEALTKPTRITLQTNELVLPSKDISGLFKGKVPQVTGSNSHSESALADEESGNLDSSVSRQVGIPQNAWLNRLVYGDNLLAMQALLAGDEKSGLPSLRGKIDLMYNDPPFDSKADYRENTENDSDPLRVVTEAVIEVPKKEKRKVCVKAVDVFGFESAVVEEVKI